MDSIDIYALFGNAIDNAIECVEKFSEKEMRFIDICVAEKQHFLYIRFSNPIERAPEYEDDLPKTTKKNKQYHGIGLKSIRHIAEKYGGGYLSIHRDELFQSGSAAPGEVKEQPSV